MSGGLGETAFELAFAISPIMFQGGIAQNIPGGVLPIGLATASQALVAGLLSGGSVPSLSQIQPRFQPMPGSTLFDVELAKYPLANQNVAANATIAQPLILSMLMFWTAQPSVGGYAAKLIGMMAMQSAVTQHSTMGGTYAVITPASFNPNMILKSIRDISSGQTAQVQTIWQWDFEAPLLTLSQAQSAQNSLMSKLTGGTQINGTPGWSTPGNAIGLPGSAQAPNVVPTATGSPGATIFPGSP